MDYRLKNHHVKPHKSTKHGASADIKSTPIHAMEKLTKIQPLNERRVEKVLVNKQKYIQDPQKLKL
jgi:hypothetical protein